MNRETPTGISQKKKKKLNRETQRLSVFGPGKAMAQLSPTFSLLFFP
jgi:hypothetical protein